MKRMVKFAAVIAAVAMLVLSSAPNAQAQSVCSPAPSNIVGWWPGDGNANDIIGGNNGTLVGGASFATGEVGPAFVFDGVDGAVEIPDSTSLRLQQLTIDFWVNPQAYPLGNDSGLVIKTRADAGWVSYGVALTWAGGIWFSVQNESLGQWPVWLSINSIPLNQWTHIAVTYSPKDFTVADGILYINGVPEPITSVGGGYSSDFSISYDTDPLMIGSDLLGNPGSERLLPFSGSLDEVEVFNRVLSASEVQAIFNAGSAGKCKGLTFSPASLRFPRRTLGTTSPADVVTANNEFPLAVTVKKVATSGDFSQTNTCPIPPSRLASGASCTVSVTFTPTQPGTRTGKLTIVDSAPASPQRVGLTGAATDISLSVTRLNFGSHKVGTTSRAQAVTATNVGSTLVNFTGGGVVLTGADPGDFVISANSCGPSLASGANCTASVEFKPTAQGTRTATLAFNDDGGASPQTVALTGSGT
jgi:hypothetical protein